MASRPHCGNGVVETDYGETCDDGINDSRLGGCTAVCTIPRCGDGLVQSAYGEDCDDGVNEGAYGRCTPRCSAPTPPVSPDCSRFTAFCGDGILQPTAGEICDDGINSGLVACGPDCTWRREGSCGDGLLQEAYEECDDGNTASCDGCSSLCQVERAVSP
jgi:cysteine-rich repeat protein